MEIAVSGVIGLLCWMCVYGALGCLDDGGTPGDARTLSSGTSPSSLRDVCLAGATALGRCLVRGGIPVARVQPVIIELRRARAPVLGALDEVGDDAALGVLVLGSLASGLFLLAVAGSLPGFAAGCLVPFGVLTARAAQAHRRERARVEEAMPEAFGALAVSLGSGFSLAQAMQYVGSHADEPVRSAFGRVAFSITCGIPAAEALDAMIARLHAPGLELVTIALKVSQRTGAPLRGLLADAAALVGECIDLTRQLDVKTSQARMSARLVACMPLAIIAFLSLLSSDFQKGVATVPGALSIAMALAMNAAAWVIIRRIMRVQL